jgi:hypothetical protein
MTMKAVHPLEIAALPLLKRKTCLELAPARYPAFKDAAD